MRPLDGVHIVVTRAVDRGAAMATALRRAGADVYEIPLTRIDPIAGALAGAVRSLDGYEWVALTSVNAVEQFVAAVTQAAIRDLADRRKFAVVGPATAAALERAGWVPTVVPSTFNAEALLDALASRTDVEGCRFLFPAAEGARETLPDGLRALGALVDVVPAYRTVADADGQRTLGALVARRAVDLVVVAAPSAVDALLDAIPPEHARRLPIACIGPVTARAARSAGFPVRVESTAATNEGLVRSIMESFAR